MVIEEPGVLWRDGIYFYSASNFAKQHLFYPMWGATYKLAEPYRIRRDYMDAFMIQYIESGTLDFKLRDEHFVAREGEIVLLDCHESNDYWSEGPAAVKWFHFNGREISPLLEHIYEANGSGHLNAFYGQQVIELVDDILKGLKTGTYSEFLFSRLLYDLLCRLAEPIPRVETPAEEAVRQSVAYIKQHFAEPITVADMASAVKLSPFYFTRLFKRFMMVPPHVYLLNYRLAEAKKLLFYTSEKIDTIAMMTGFTSSSYFVRAFRREMNMTPKTFRRYFSSTGQYRFLDKLRTKENYVKDELSSKQNQSDKSDT